MSFCDHAGFEFTNVSNTTTALRLVVLMQSLILKTCRLYNVFGSGAQHAVYAQFIAQSTMSNNGRPVGLIRGAGTRMALWFYAMMRLLRLKQPLKATVHQRKFLDLKLNSSSKAAALDIQDDKFWRRMYVLLRAVFPALKALRYCDSSQPMMDKLYFLTHKTTQALKNSEQYFNDRELFGTTTIDIGLENESQIVFGEENEDNEMLVEDTPLAVVQVAAEEEEEDDEEEEEGEKKNDDGGDGDEDESNSNIAEGEEGADEEVVDENSLGRQLIRHWDHRRVKLEHDYSIAGWVLCILPEVQQDVKARLNGDHRDAIERVVERLHIPPCANPNEKVCAMAMADVVDTFWKEFKEFQNREGKFSKMSRWSCKDVIDGRSHAWHENYSLPHTLVLGFVACRVTSKLCGIGAAERSWGGVKTIKDGNRAHMGCASVEKRAIIYTTARIMDARAKRESLEKIDAGKNGMFCDDDLKFDLELEKFGVNLNELKGLPVKKRIFRAWVEGREEDIRYTNDCVVKAILLEKYKDLVFTVTDPHSSSFGRTFTVSSSDMEFRRGKKRGAAGWMVIGETADDEEDEGTFSLEDACRYIGSIPQEDGVNVIHRNGEGEDDD